MLSEMMCRRIFQQAGFYRKHGWSRRKARSHRRNLHRITLRPLYEKGGCARGMRAPKNTNQFLMHEKYQMQQMRSDSVGSEGSDSDTELTDMDSYLGVLENARGALLDSPTTDTPARHQEDGVHAQEGGAHMQEDAVHAQEDSMQYFPSEDDLLQSQNFMQRDFLEFCDFLAP